MPSVSHAQRSTRAAHALDRRVESMSVAVGRSPRCTWHVAQLSDRLAEARGGTGERLERPSSSPRRTPWPSSSRCRWLHSPRLPTATQKLVAVQLTALIERVDVDVTRRRPARAVINGAIPRRVHGHAEACARTADGIEGPGGVGVGGGRPAGPVVGGHIARGTHRHAETGLTHWSRRMARVESMSLGGLQVEVTVA